MKPFTFTCEGLRIYNIANQRWHWSKVAKYMRQTKHLVWAYAMQAGLRNRSAEIFKKALVTITRTGPKTLDDDGLVSSVKPVLDSLKRGYCGLIEDDSPEHCKVVVKQEKGPYSVKITVEKLTK